MILGLLVGLAQAEIVDRVAAVVNKDVITLSEIYELGGEFVEERAAGEGALGPNRVAAEIEVLDALIRRSLIDQEIDRLGLSVTGDELDRAIDDIARQNGMERDALIEEVERTGLPYAAYREELGENIKQMKFSQLVIQPRISIGDDEILSLYNQRTEQFASDGTRGVDAILLRFETDAAPEEKAAIALKGSELKARADGGESWSDLVASTPESPYSAGGGDMGTFTQGELLPELDEVVWRLPLDSVSDPIAAAGGIWLVHVRSEQAGEVPALDAVREDLHAELLDQKLEQELDLWYSQARRRAAVDVKLE